MTFPINGRGVRNRRNRGRIHGHQNDGQIRDRTTARNHGRSDARGHECNVANSHACIDTYNWGAQLLENNGDGVRDMLELHSC